MQCRVTARFPRVDDAETGGLKRGRIVCGDSQAVNGGNGSDAGICRPDSFAGSASADA
jgi:hypothetical protein